MQPSFNVVYKGDGSRARLGRLETEHGVVETPAFIFCATKAAIKGLDPGQVKACGTQIILANTYHLMLQPGSDQVAARGGLHRFMGWSGPMLTDSGGYQIFSLGHGSVSAELKGQRQQQSSLLRITEDGAEFRSYLDGKKLLLTPERAMRIQEELGADLIVVLDECTPFHVDKAYTQAAMERSHRWALRCIQAKSSSQGLYGIVQGGVYADLRREAVSFVRSQEFFGLAIGGSLGANKEQMQGVVGQTMDYLHDDVRPIHLLGIGGVSDIFYGVSQGVDTFDCVHPTRLARHGGALVRGEDFRSEQSGSGQHFNLKNSRFRGDDRPIDSDCPCSTCANFSRAYLHHLLAAKEVLALSALTCHNMTFMNRLLAGIRGAIKAGTLEAEAKMWL